MSEALRAAAQAVIDEVTAWALAAFGWTHVALAPIPIAPDRVALHGTVVAPRLLARVQQQLAARGIASDADAVTWLRGDHFVAVAAALPLWRRPDRRAADELVTELLPGDGPLERLAQQHGASLVRAPDATLGWAHAPLGEPVAPRTLGTEPLRPEVIADAVPRWLGTPYRLGGATLFGVDCSALVQRLLAQAGACVPRHSADQIAIDPQRGAGPDVCGTLVALWSADEAPCHVGLRLGQGQIVHASRSRGAVVIDATARAQRDAARLAHVPLAAIAALQQRARGATSLLGLLAPATAPPSPADEPDARS
ncbi:MAG: C40 family peptidase [Nannocystaceae bacterium]|nr:C40 family peptidase [Nannocystaceae bacterium]